LLAAGLLGLRASLIFFIYMYVCVSLCVCVSFWRP
jgi:hypothetical protein